MAHSGLRKLIRNSTWGKEVEAIEIVDAADLVVGADGTWSRNIRHQPDSDVLAEPTSTGVTFIEGHICDVDTRFKEIAGLVFAADDNKGIIVQRNSGTRMRVHLALRVGEDWKTTSKITLDEMCSYLQGATYDGSRVSVKTRLKDLFDAWSPRLTSVIDACDEKFFARRSYALPVDTAGATTLV
ncbi:hypothetical protein FISHEDRAFT_71420 [Fistulina hepatica ATCC 64428]|nr:hypothetical protein FISHEDRAFT_71420 [Fistulina hepatica ATCC 64428]